MCAYNEVCHLPETMMMYTTIDLAAGQCDYCAHELGALLSMTFEAWHHARAGECQWNQQHISHATLLLVPPQL